jgi:hypothetical protein
LTAALALSLLLVQRTIAGRPHDPVPAPPTFAGEIRALLAARCTTCHAPNGSAPMPLTTSEELRPWAAAIKQQILTRHMPKWHAARGYGAFLNDPTLTPYEQALWVSWIDAGMPEGTPRGTAAARPLARLAPRREDDIATTAIVAAQGDVGRASGQRAEWITGWTFSPGDPLITAAVVSVDGAPVATWVAGDRATALPPGTGFRSGARIRVDVRRRAAAPHERLYVPRRSLLTLITTARPGLRRAWTEQVACGALRSGPAAELLAVRPLLDRPEARLSIARLGAPATIVGWFREFDPLYPRTYWLLRPIEMGPDARLTGEGPCRVELTLATARR